MFDIIRLWPSRLCAWPSTTCRTCRLRSRRPRRRRALAGSSGLLFYARQAESARRAPPRPPPGTGRRSSSRARSTTSTRTARMLAYVTQKTVGLTASVPLFEDAPDVAPADRQKHLATAAERRARPRGRAARARLGQGARDAGVPARPADARRPRRRRVRGARASDLPRPIKAGRSSYLDVQTYDLSALPGEGRRRADARADLDPARDARPTRRARNDHEEKQEMLAIPVLLVAALVAWKFAARANSATRAPSRRPT